MKLIFAAIASLVVIAATGATSPDVYDGRSRFDQGDAYYFWKDGGKWHLRWVASDRGRDFKGIVSATGGGILSVQENDSEKETLAYLASQRRINVSTDRADPGIRIPDVPSLNRAVIRQDGTDKIVFDARTTNSIGGFDFVAADGVASIQLDLLFDKKPATVNLLRLGKGSRKAPQMPLVVNLVPAS